MKANEFYNSVKKFDVVFLENGFKKIRRNQYIKPGFKLHVVLDRWGWEKKRGWGFFIRVTDNRYEGLYSSHDYAHGCLDINAYSLIERQILNREQLYDIYDHLESLESLKNDYWITFYDTEELVKVLDLLLMPVLENIESWIKYQKKKPLITNSLKNKAKRNELLDDLKQIFPDANIS
ncbi:hypothetical protein IPP75_01055 [Candidatus Saccharibacteria bacterium]|nr:MAG: hypothetical protein IPP75_01055 [Candidatus Saccharibacteria bacterium]